MRILMIAVALTACSLTAAAQSRDPSTLLNEMREALGGAAALDAVKSFSVSGDVRMTMAGRSRVLSQEIHGVLPDRFLRVRRDSTDGPLATNIIYYDGFRENELIRRTDATGLQFPDPNPDQSPAGVAKWRAQATIRSRQAFARLSLALFGTSFSSYPLQYAYAGTETVDGSQRDVIEATAADGFAMRLHIDPSTHLPAMITWQGERGFTVKTSTMVTTRGNTVVSQSPASPPTLVGPPPGGGLVELRWVLSDFKRENGLNWPRTIKETGADLTEEVRFRSVKINPQIDPRKFDIK